VCLSDGTYSSCSGCYDVASRPCTSPGVEYSCACSGGSQGKKICLTDGSFTKCVCPTSSAAVAEGGVGNAGAEAIAAAAAAAGPCPSGFSCSAQTANGMTQKVCVLSSTLPPFCKSETTNASDECKKAGLSSAACMEVERSGVKGKVCIQLCN
jgi:hypothetical protein